MSITGKGTKSIRKLPVAQSSITNVGFKVTRALHECSEDQTLIQLSSLTAPSTAVNYSAPSPSEMVKTNILLFQDNVKLTSSLRGPLMKNIAWVPTGASSIKLLFNAEALEIIEILIDHNAKSSVNMVDADSTPISGTLAAGQTDFNLGNPFEVGKYPSQQHGMYIIYIDGQLAYRNTGNSAPGVGVTGDYYEVHAGAGLGTLIRLNSADLVNDRAISAIPSGALVERPNGSQMAVMEALQGQIDALVPTVAALAEVPETDFQGTPNQIDLKAFGDRVLALEKILDIEVKEYNYLGALPTTGTWVNNTSYTGVYWQDGDYLVGVVAVALTGAPNGVNLSLNLPTGYTANSAKLQALPGAAAMVDGIVNEFENGGGGSGRLPAFIVLGSATTLEFRPIDDSSASSHFLLGGIGDTVPVTVGAGDGVQIMFRIPVNEFGTGKKSLRTLAGL